MSQYIIENIEKIARNQRMEKYSIDKVKEVYDDEQIRRHEVLPGLTGWAQINGRNSITWSEKFKLDVWYVDNWSLWLDIKIFFLTFWKVIKREGINQSESVTMEYFNGTN